MKPSHWVNDLPNKIKLPSPEKEIYCFPNNNRTWRYGINLSYFRHNNEPYPFASRLLTYMSNIPSCLRCNGRPCLGPSSSSAARRNRATKSSEKARLQHFLEHFSNKNTSPLHTLYSTFLARVFISISLFLIQSISQSMHDILNSPV